MKAKSTLAIALVLVMMIAAFAWMPNETSSKPNIDPQSYDPTASPSPTNQQTSTPTAKPTSNPPSHSAWNPISIITTIMEPTPKPPGLIEGAPAINSTVWRAVAANAWKYFLPGTGVDANTGLPRASLTYPYFTDWDLGVYLQAVIDANKTGLIGYTGDWGSTARIEKVLTFLENRELNNGSYPFWFYQASDGKNYHASSDKSTNLVDTVDTGRLFVALNNLKAFNSSLASRIDNFVYNNFGNRSDYSSLVPSVLNDCKVSTSIYTYYYASGFAGFWPNELAGATNTILNNINNAGNVTTGLFGASLPKGTISCEPLMASVFELNNNPKLTTLAKQVYLAHEAKYNATGEYVAFSEGNTPTGFIYEWVVLPNGDTWKVMNSGETTYSNMNPIIYTKVALSFLALYNTSFARNMCVYLERAFPDTSSGYFAGADYNVDYNAAGLVLSTDSNSNGMILGASRYAIQNKP